MLLVVLLLCRQRAEFIPATTLGQLLRWSAVALSELFRGSVDLGRPADICLYHIGCFDLLLPSGYSLPLAGVALYGLQQQHPQYSMDQVLETFRQAGAVLRLRQVSGSDLRDSQQVGPSKCPWGRAWGLVVPAERVPRGCSRELVRGMLAGSLTSLYLVWGEFLPPLAGHTEEAAKRYSANSNYELSDLGAAVLRLVSGPQC